MEIGLYTFGDLPLGSRGIQPSPVGDHRGGKACGSGGLECLRHRRASSPRLYNLGARGRHGRDCRSDQEYSHHHGGYHFIVIRSGKHFRRIGNDRPAVRWPRRTDPRTRRIHRVLSTVWLRSQRLRRALRRKACATAEDRCQRRSNAARAVSRSTSPRSLHAPMSTVLRSGSAPAGHPTASYGRARRASRSTLPISVGNRRASVRSSIFTAAASAMPVMIRLASKSAYQAICMSRRIASVRVTNSIRIMRAISATICRTVTTVGKSLAKTTSALPAPKAHSSSTRFYTNTRCSATIVLWRRSI